MAEALQPLQRALRFQTQGNASRQAASTPPQSRPATPQLNPPPRGAWRTRGSVIVRGFEEEMPISPVERLVDLSSPRVGTTELTDRRRHRTQSEINGSSSSVLPPRLHLVAHVAVLVAMCVKNKPATKRFIGEMEPCRLTTVAHSLPGMMNAIVEPHLA